MLSAIGNRQNVEAVEFAYPSQGKDIVNPNSDSTKALILHSITAYNNNASACNIGIGKAYANASWKAYTLTASQTDITTSIQAGTTNTFFDTTNNHGIYVQNKGRFAMLYFNIVQASSGSPVFEYTYWNGTTFATLNLITAPVYSGTGPVYVPFLPPLDWSNTATGVSGIGTVQGSSGYVIRIRATTASGQNITVNAMTVSKFYAYRGQIAANQQLQVTFERPKIIEANEGVAIYYGTANNLNAVELSYQLGG